MNNRNQVRLGVTTLEARDVPAVFANFSSGTLTVTIADGNSGPAGSVLVTPNHYGNHHTADIAGDFNGSNPRVRVNGIAITRDNSPVGIHPNSPNLVRTNEIKRIVVNGSNSADLIRLDLMEKSQDWRDLNGQITVNAKGGDDTIRGSKFSDKLFGGSGNDRLEGRDGNDFLYGEAGNDTLVGGNGNDTHDGGAGTDKVIGFVPSKDKKFGIETLANS